MTESRVVVLGAGPAGLTAAYLLGKQGLASVVLERDNVVGGISRTAVYKDYRFDIGGHRFFTKVAAVEALWREVLGEDLITRSRLSRIYYKRRFFSYPLKPMNALTGLGLLETTRCLASYAKAHLQPQEPENDFETWVSNRFGKRLYEIFFRTYTEKVWGLPCSQIDAEWAAQRIKGLSLASAIRNAVFGETATTKQGVIKTLIDEVLYPRLGPGMMWERTRELAEERGAEVRFDSKVQKVIWGAAGVAAVTSNGEEYEAADYISTIALDELVESLEPAAPPEVAEAASRLRYRDFLTVALIVNRPDLFPDNWIYVHDPDVKLGRVQNFGNWSPEMVPDPSTSCIGLEYFCHEGDDLWTSTDDALVRLGKAEIAKLGLVDPANVVEGTVVRMPKAYPVYDSGYASAVEVIRTFVAERLPNLQLVGRNGMHRYNNQDHSMLTAMLAVRNILGARYDLWQVNVDDEYHEEGSMISEDDIREMERTQPLTPRAKTK